MRQFLLLFLISFTAFAQEQEAIIYFRDGSTASGYGEIKTENFLKMPVDPIILFRISQDEKADEWGPDMVSKIEFFEDHYKVYAFVETRTGDNVKYRLLEPVTEGKVSLYTETIKSSIYSYQNAVSGSGMPGRLGSYQESEKTVYMVKKDTESKLTTFGANKNKIIEYFKDCPGIRKKFNSNEFSVKDLKDIVEYYNEYCADGKNVDIED